MGNTVSAHLGKYFLSELLSAETRPTGGMIGIVSKFTIVVVRTDGKPPSAGEKSAAD